MSTSSDLIHAPDAPARAPGDADPGMSFRAFVALMASIQACNALGIDSMLPALPAIGRALAIPTANDRQWIIAVYVFGFGAAQLVYGPMADRYGRRPLLVVSLGLFSLLSIAAAFSGSFTGLIVARLLQGIAGAGGRVLTVCVIRDCYSGRQMARVMSLSFMVFLLVPVLAPTIGQGILLVASWRLIFLFLAAYVGGVALIGFLRLKETLHPEFRRPATFAGVTSAMRRVATDRAAIGYTLAATLMFGALMSLIDSIQQVFADDFHAAGRFPLVFACIAGSMALASFINSRIVERLGTRRVSHAGLIGFILTSALHVAVAAAGRETMFSFALIQCLQLFCFGMTTANFNSMAMEPMGAIAGTAASVQGFVSTCGGAIIGLVIGQMFDGTTLPMALGFCGLGVLALLLVLATERGRLFGTHRPAAA